MGSRSPRPQRLSEALGHLADFHRSLSGSSRRHAARNLQASSLAVAQRIQSARARGSGTSRARRPSLGLSFLGAGRGISGGPPTPRPAREDSHRSADSPSTLPTHRQEGLPRLCLSFAPSPPLAQAGSSATPCPGQSPASGSIQKKLPQLFQEALTDRPPTLPVRLLFQDEVRFGRLSDERRCWAPWPERPCVGKQIIREYAYGLVAVSLRDLDHHPEGVKSTTNFDWINTLCRTSN